MFDVIAIIILVAVLSLLFNKRVDNSRWWRATVTPLASIIGSGFLVSTPLLVMSVGKYAIIAMVVIVVIAYGLGSAMRANIRHLEPLLKGRSHLHDYLCKLEVISRPILGIAYIISATFYLKLMAAFLLKYLHLPGTVYNDILTTSILAIIGVVGFRYGLRMLENLEKYAVNSNLAIIAAFIVCLIIYNFMRLKQGTWHITFSSHDSTLLAVRKLLGILIVVQGFEISRYLGKAYSPEMRIRTMRYAQIISGLIYVLFITVALIMFDKVAKVNATTVVDISYMVTPLLAIALIIGAALSQFSASTADIVGGGELIVEAVGRRITDKESFLFMAVIAIILTWVTNIYEIIVLASKAFALYYAIHTFISIFLAHRNYQGLHRIVSIFLYSGLTLLMLAVIFFGIPSE